MSRLSANQPLINAFFTEVLCRKFSRVSLSYLSRESLSSFSPKSVSAFSVFAKGSKSGVKNRKSAFSTLVHTRHGESAEGAMEEGAERKASPSGK